MAKSDVFISYSHRDARFKDELLAHLRALENQGVAKFWDTSEIPAGADWSTEIKKAINDAEVAILLVSPDFLASEFLMNEELPALLKRAEERNTLILPILVRNTAWFTIAPELAQFQFLNDVRKPLAASSRHGRERQLASIAQHLTELLTAQIRRAETEKQVTEAVPVTPSKTPSKGKPLVFLSHSKLDGDFAELAKFKFAEVGFEAWIDNDRLEPGVDWRQEIDDSIQKSIALIAIMSPEARESEYVTYEWSFAWGAKKHVIPVMLRETPLHPRLAALQYLDFTNRRARPWSRLFEAIQRRNDG
jgi:hypothetical protein